MFDDGYQWFYSEGEEIETRRIVNAFIRREYVTMPKWCWRYFDWMHEQGFYMAAWTRELDLHRGAYPLGDMLHYALWCVDCRAMQNRDPRPDFLPPAEGWEDYEDTADPERPAGPLS